MMRNPLPKIILGVILVLLALHLAVSNVSIKSEGTWKQPKFSFSLTKDGSSTSSAAAAAPSTTSNVLKDEKTHNEEPPSMWDDLQTIEITTTSSSAISQEAPSGAGHVDPTEPTGAKVHSAGHVDPSEPTTAIVHSADYIDPQEPTGAIVHTASHTVSHAFPTPEVDPHANHGNETMLPCSELEGAEDVVFIIKTGATELDERIPVHFNTTLRCFPKSLVFSDHGENYEGHTVHDALGNVIDQIRLKHEDFDLWRRLHEKGRSGLDPSELSINDHGSNLGGGGNPNNGGWRLDKFKNIPMVNYTIHMYPDTKWFIYTDADTYIMWTNLLKWIKLMDSTKLVYLGSPAVIDDQVFGHGGSGYLVSNALMHKAADAYNQDQAKWDNYAQSHWAGDCVLATLFEKLNGKLSWAYPMIQGGDNNVMDYWETGYDKRLWCYPAISYHHIPPSTVESLWHFEQEWMANSSERITHGDVYKQWYLPQLPHEREGWDNLSEDEIIDTSITDAWACRDSCQRNTTCMQWSFTDGGCNFQQSTKLGNAAHNVHSGWMLDRIYEKVEELDECEEGDWIMPDYHGSKRVKRGRLALEARRKYK